MKFLCPKNETAAIGCAAVETCLSWCSTGSEAQRGVPAFLWLPLYLLEPNRGRRQTLRCACCVALVDEFIQKLQDADFVDALLIFDSRL